MVLSDLELQIGLAQKGRDFDIVFAQSHTCRGCIVRNLPEQLIAQRLSGLPDGMMLIEIFTHHHPAFVGNIGAWKRNPIPSMTRFVGRDQGIQNSKPLDNQ